MAADLPPREQIAFGSSSGQTNGHRWRIDIGPMSEQAKASGDKPVWIPALVRVQVRSPSGAVMDVRTVRLIHGQQP
jgi:general secretion pathway protein I